LKALSPGKDTRLAGMAVSPDGKSLAVAGDKIVYRWSLPAGDLLPALPLKDYVSGVAFSPDGTTLYTAGRTVQAIDLANSGALKKLKGHDSVFRGFSLAGPAGDPKGQILAAVWHAQVKIWNLKTYEETPIKIQAGAISSGVLRPDGRVFALADGAIRLWDLQTGREMPPLPSSLGGAALVAFSPDGSQLACAAGATIQIHKMD
jgi:WD40 repeat protein